MGLLGFLKKAGSGVNNWLDEGAMEALGPGLSTLLATPGQTPIPKAGLLAPRPLPQQAPLTAPPQQQPLATDPTADSGNDPTLDGSPPVSSALPLPSGPSAAIQRGRGAAAPNMAPMDQPIQMTAGTPGHAWQPSAEDKKAIRGAYVSNFLNNMGNVLQGRGGTGTQEFRQDILTQLVLQHQAEQSSQQMAQKQQVLQGFSQDMQSAGTDPDMQRKALNKWAPYVGADMAKAFGDIAKDYGPKPLEIRTITDAAGNTREMAFDPIKGTLTALPGGVGAKPETFQKAEPYIVDKNPIPVMLVQDSKGQLRVPGPNGQVIDPGRITPYAKPLDSVPEQNQNDDYAAYSQKFLVSPQFPDGKPVAQMNATEKVAARNYWMHLRGQDKAQIAVNTYQIEHPQPTATEALANVPKSLWAQAAGQYGTATRGYLTAQQAADDMKTFIDMARSGNKIAYAYAPTEGVLTLNTGRGIKRVNMPEIQSYGGAGSARDKVMGFLGKMQSGASIPPDVLDAMEQIHEAVRQNAWTNYSRQVSGINANYQSRYQPMTFGNEGAAQPAGPVQVKRDKNGKLIMGGQ